MKYNFRNIVEKSLFESADEAALKNQLHSHGFQLVHGTDNSYKHPDHPTSSISLMGSTTPERLQRHFDKFGLKPSHQPSINKPVGHESGASEGVVNILHQHGYQQKAHVGNIFKHPVTGHEITVGHESGVVSTSGKIKNANSLHGHQQLANHAMERGYHVASNNGTNGISLKNDVTGHTIDTNDHVSSSHGLTHEVGHEAIASIDKKIGLHQNEHTQNLAQHFSSERNVSSERDGRNTTFTHKHTGEKFTITPFTTHEQVKSAVSGMRTNHAAHMEKVGNKILDDVKKHASIMGLDPSHFHQSTQYGTTEIRHGSGYGTKVGSHDHNNYSTTSGSNIVDNTVGNILRVNHNKHSSHDLKNMLAHHNTMKKAGFEVRNTSSDSHEGLSYHHPVSGAVIKLGGYQAEHQIAKHDDVMSKIKNGRHHETGASISTRGESLNSIADKVHEQDGIASKAKMMGVHPTTLRTHGEANIAKMGNNSPSESNFKKHGFHVVSQHGDTTIVHHESDPSQHIEIKHKNDGSGQVSSDVLSKSHIGHAEHSMDKVLQYHAEKISKTQPTPSNHEKSGANASLSSVHSEMSTMGHNMNLQKSKDLVRGNLDKSHESALNSNHAETLHKLSGNKDVSAENLAKLAAHPKLSSDGISNIINHPNVTKEALHHLMNHANTTPEQKKLIVNHPKTV